MWMVICCEEWSKREKVKSELGLQKHQRELFVKEGIKPKDWIPIELEESKRAFGSERKRRSGE